MIHNLWTWRYFLLLGFYGSFTGFYSRRLIAWLHANMKALNKNGKP